MRMNTILGPAVAIFAILRSKTNAFPLSTVIIEQYRPPIDKIIIGTYHRYHDFTCLMFFTSISELPAGMHLIIFIQDIMDHRRRLA